MSLATITGAVTLATISFFSSDFELPLTWEKDFIISASHHGSMSAVSSSITFTYETCTYTVDPRNGASAKKTFSMTEKDRVAILKKLRNVHVDNIIPKQLYVAVNDGWSTSICLGSHCIEGGTSVELSDKDKDAFLTAYAYLEQFAIDKTNSSKIH